MTKLQKHFAYKYKDKNHYKHVVVIPEGMIQKLGWESGVKLQQVVDGKKLILSPDNAETDMGSETSIVQRPRRKSRAKPKAKQVI